MNNRKWTWYTVYGIIVTIVFLYLLFPSDQFGNYLVKVISDNNPEIALSMDRASLGFPLAVKMTNLVVDFKERQGSTIEAAFVRVRPAFTDLLRGRETLLVRAKAYNGDVRLEASSEGSFSKGTPVALNVDLDDVHIGKCSYIRSVFGRGVEGRLGGTLKYNGKIGDVIRGTGELELTLLDAGMDLEGQMFGFEKLTFDEMKATMALKNRTLKVDTLNIDGREVSGSFDGNVFLNRDIVRSRLALKGNLDIPTLNKKLSVQLGGTVSNPIPRFK
jgi:type II secretion system protein N